LLKLNFYRIWSFDNDFLPWIQDEMNLIPSDSALRSDLKAISENDYTSAQKLKDEYENKQRGDKKLREAVKTQTLTQTQTSSK
jgi:hypothetical protein